MFATVMPPLAVSGFTIERGDASLWEGAADLVFTHPYAALPGCLRGKPAIINLVESKGARGRGEAWVGSELTPIGAWGRRENVVYVANMLPVVVALGDLVEDQVTPHEGWMPQELPRRLLKAYADVFRPGLTVWDGFCGRGTIGRACRKAGLNYIGIDKDPARVELAREYVGQNILRGAAA